MIYISACSVYTSDHFQGNKAHSWKYKQELTHKISVALAFSGRRAKVHLLVVLWNGGGKPHLPPEPHVYTHWDSGNPHNDQNPAHMQCRKAERSRKDKSERMTWQGLPNRGTRSCIQAELRIRRVSIWPLLCSQGGKCPLVYSMAYARYRSVSACGSPAGHVPGWCARRGHSYSQKVGVYEGVTVLRPHSQCLCDRSSLASPPFHRFRSVPWGTSGRLLSGALHLFPSIPVKTNEERRFSPCFFDFTTVSQTSGLGGRRGGIGEKNLSWHWEICHPMSMIDVPAQSSWLLCHHCSDRPGRVQISWFQINLGRFTITSNDALALR